MKGCQDFVVHFFRGVARFAIQFLQQTAQTTQTAPQKKNTPKQQKVSTPPQQTPFTNRPTHLCHSSLHVGGVQQPVRCAGDLFLVGVVHGQDVHINAIDKLTTTTQNDVAQFVAPDTPTVVAGVVKTVGVLETGQLHGFAQAERTFVEPKQHVAVAARAFGKDHDLRGRRVQRSPFDFVQSRVFVGFV